MHIYGFKLNFKLFEGCRLTPPFQQPCKKIMLICKEIILCKKISSFSFVGVGDFPKGFMHCTQCKIKYKCWNFYTHKICVAFCVLILKVVTMYSKALLVVALKESECKWSLYIIINPWSSWIKTYGWIYKFVPINWCMMYFCFYKI